MPGTMRTLLALAVACLALVSGQTQQNPAFRARADLVVVPVVVVDKSGKTVPDLGREDGRFDVLLLDDLSTPLTRGWKVYVNAEYAVNSVWQDAGS